MAENSTSLASVLVKKTEPQLGTKAWLQSLLREGPHSESHFPLNSGSRDTQQHSRYQKFILDSRIPSKSCPGPGQRLTMTACHSQGNTLSCVCPATPHKHTQMCKVQQLPTQECSCTLPYHAHTAVTRRTPARQELHQEAAWATHPVLVQHEVALGNAPGHLPQSSDTGSHLTLLASQ